MARICQENPDRPFWAAAVALTRALYDRRMTAKPQMVAMTAGGQSMSLVRETLRQALEAFQGDSQLAVSWLPDPETRARLLQ